MELLSITLSKFLLIFLVPFEYFLVFINRLMVDRLDTTKLFLGVDVKRWVNLQESLKGFYLLLLVVGK